MDKDLADAIFAVMGEKLAFLDLTTKGEDDEKQASKKSYFKQTFKDF